MSPASWLQGTAALLAACWQPVEGRIRRRHGRRLPAVASPGSWRVLILASVAALALGGWMLATGSLVDGTMNRHDVFHYYLGAKYFPELGYTGLYECALLADVQDGLAGDLGQRNIRDLHSNRIQSALALASEPRRCLERFEPGRWAAFRRDVAWFRARMPRQRYEEIMNDHGFNGSPAWVLLGRALVFRWPASDLQMRALVLVDPLALFLMWALAWRTFGWRSTILALVFWTTNYPARLHWLGGCFLRNAWLVLLVTGVCLMKRQRIAAGAGAIAAAGSLRLFPALLLAGPALAGAMASWRRRALDPALARLLLGVAAALVCLAIVSTVAAGPRSWPRFVEKIVRHQETPSINTMGLKALASYSPQLSASRLFNSQQRDAYAPWRDARRMVYERRRPTFYALSGLFLLLAALAFRGRAPWETASLAALLMPVLVVASCYYYSMLLVLAFLRERSPGSASALCAYSAITCVPVALLGDVEQVYVYQSIAAIALALAVIGGHVLHASGGDGGELRGGSGA